MYIEDIKKLLYELGVFENNEWLDKYCLLMYNNLTTQKEKFKTQKHHLIPIAYYKMIYDCKSRKEAEEYSNKTLNPTINLLYKDHVLAHLYLTKCVSNLKLNYKLLSAVNRVLRTFKLNDYEEYLDFISNNHNLIQLHYEKAKHINCLKEDTPSKISKSLVGRVSITKDRKYKYIPKDKLDYYLDLGWILGHNKQNENSKKKISETNKNRVKINKDGINKSVKKIYLENYLNLGWNLGQYKSSDFKAHNKGKVSIHNKNNKIKYILNSEVKKYLSLGWMLGNGRTHTCSYKGKKMPKSHYDNLVKGNGLRGKTPMNKEGKIVYVKKDEVDFYLSQGYNRGIGYKPIGTKGKRWIHNDLEEIYVTLEELPRYLDLGWLLGRINKGAIKNGRIKIKK